MEFGMEQAQEVLNRGMAEAEEIVKSPSKVDEILLQLEENFYRVVCSMPRSFFRGLFQCPQTDDQENDDDQQEQADYGENDDRRMNQQPVRKTGAGACGIIRQGVRRPKASLWLKGVSYQPTRITVSSVSPAAAAGIRQSTVQTRHSSNTAQRLVIPLTSVFSFDTALYHICTRNRRSAHVSSPGKRCEAGKWQCLDLFRRNRARAGHHSTSCRRYPQNTRPAGSVPPQRGRS